MALDEPALAKLCKSCKYAHGPLLRDHGVISKSLYYNRNARGSPLLYGGQLLFTDVWPLLPRLTESKAGCVFCAFLRESLLSKVFSDAYEHLTKSSSASASQKTLRLVVFYEQAISLASWPYPHNFNNPFLNQDIVLIVKAEFDSGHTVDMHFEIEADPDFPAVAKYLGIKAPILRDYEHEEFTSFLTRQLSSIPLRMCSDSRDACFMPERLIEVGPSSLRLVEQATITATSVGQSDYCALSYCWGPREDAQFQAKTTRANLHRNLKSLIFGDLPQVLQDAVTATRILSIPYLWVDALCILQDDNSDWEMQCSNMNEIYGNARVTIIAASSRTCTEGFLKPRRPVLRFPYQSALNDEIRGLFVMHFTHAFGQIKVKPEDKLKGTDCFIDLHNDLHSSQWARRGWTFQEHTMAQAHIVFGTSGLYFGRDGKYVTKDGEAGPIAQASIASLQTNQELHRAWEIIMRRYSACNKSSFTNIKDLLPALSGLAREYGNRLQFEETSPVNYIAGHWLEKLYCTLLWRNWILPVTEAPSLGEIKTRHNQDEYLIPTWSCLTHNAGSLSFYHHEPDYLDRLPHLQSEVEIMDVHAPLVGSDPYGAIQNASITLKGLVLDFNALSWSETARMLVGIVDGQNEIWLGSNSESQEILISTTTFYVCDRTGESEPNNAPIDRSHIDQRHIDQRHIENAQPRHGCLAHCFSCFMPSRRKHESSIGDDSSRGISYKPDNHHRPVIRRAPVYGYNMMREYKSKQGEFAATGRMKASFDELMSQVVLLLVASQHNPSDPAELNGCGLLLTRLHGAPKNSFLRVGMFYPHKHRGGLSPLKRLMKEETIKLF